MMPSVRWCLLVVIAVISVPLAVDAQSHGDHTAENSSMPAVMHFGNNMVHDAMDQGMTNDTSERSVNHTMQGLMNDGIKNNMIHGSVDHGMTNDTSSRSVNHTMHAPMDHGMANNSMHGPLDHGKHGGDGTWGHNGHKVHDHTHGEGSDHGDTTQHGYGHGTRTAENGGHGAVHDVAGHYGYFHVSYHTVILFEEWATSTWLGLLASAFGVGAASVLYEGFKVMRQEILRRHVRAGKYTEKSSYRNQMFSWMHVVQSLLNGIQLIYAYLLMLVFMTFNLWLCGAIAVGSVVGYFLFAWRRHIMNGDHCM